MGCAASRYKTKISISQLEKTVNTGDIILFSSKHAASHVTKLFTASTWDHVGMVVKLSPKHVFILEYAGGVFLYPLVFRLYSYFAIQGREIVLRRLVLGEGQQIAQSEVEHFIRGVLGKRTPSIEEMVRAVLKQEEWMRVIYNTLKGGNDDDKPKEDNLKTLFCSKLIAALYKRMGLLPESVESSDFLPKHFSQSSEQYLLLTGGASLEAEVPISFDEVEEEVKELQMSVRQGQWLSAQTTMQHIIDGYARASRWTSDTFKEVGDKAVATYGAVIEKVTTDRSSLLNQGADVETETENGTLLDPSDWTETDNEESAHGAGEGVIEESGGGVHIDLTQKV